MAVLYISEYQGPGTPSGNIPTGIEPSTDQTVAISAGSAQSTTLANNTQYIRVSTDAVCSIKVGVNPTATATNRRMAANTAEYFAIPLSSGYKIAVITNT